MDKKSNAEDATGKIRKRVISDRKERKRRRQDKKRNKRVR